MNLVEESSRDTSSSREKAALYAFIRQLMPHTPVSDEELEAAMGDGSNGSDVGAIMNLKCDC